MQTLAAEAGLALERTRSRGRARRRARARAPDRPDLAAHVRSRRDLDELLQVAVEETAKAAHVDRCFIRLGEPGEPMPILAEWDAPGVSRRSTMPAACPSSNLAARERRTVAVGDVLDAPELDDPDARRRPRADEPRASRAALATPIVAFERVIGVLGLHRAEPGELDASPRSRSPRRSRHEAAIAIDTSRLLRESDRRLAEQRALLKAGRGADERPPRRRRDRPPRPGAARARRRRRSRLLDVRAGRP